MKLFVLTWAEYDDHHICGVVTDESIALSWMNIDNDRRDYIKLELGVIESEEQIKKLGS